MRPLHRNILNEEKNVARIKTLSSDSDGMLYHLFYLTIVTIISNCQIVYQILHFRGMNCLNFRQ